MDNARFSIIAAVKNAYAFARREWAYLLKAGLLPIAMQIAGGFVTKFYRPEAGIFEVALWGLPATLFFSWFVFAEARLLLLGERLDRLPSEPSYLGERQNAMTISIIMGTLFSMGMLFAWIVLLVLAARNEVEPNPLYSFCGLFLVGGIFWALRFGIAPVLAAVRYPFRPVFRQTWGILFSLRLAGLAVACVIPTWFFFETLVSIYVMAAHPELTPETLNSLTLTPAEGAGVIIVDALRHLITLSLLTAAGVFAMREVLGTKKTGGGA